jgi:hypothetical protein
MADKSMGKILVYDSPGEQSGNGARKAWAFLRRTPIPGVDLSQWTYPAPHPEGKPELIEPRSIGYVGRDPELMNAVADVLRRSGAYPKVRVVPR